MPGRVGLDEELLWGLAEVVDHVDGALLHVLVLNGVNVHSTLVPVHTHMETCLMWSLVFPPSCYGVCAKVLAHVKARAHTHVWCRAFLRLSICYFVCVCARVFVVLRACTGEAIVIDEIKIKRRGKKKKRDPY